METRLYTAEEATSIESLVREVFSKSEGEKEGALIGKLSKELMSETSAEDLYGFVAVENQQIIGAIFFSRITIDRVSDIFILGPVAVDSNMQRKGIGQRLIKYGLDVLRDNEVDHVLTYGDPAYYCKVGFKQISDETLIAPYKLSMPFGWLGQSFCEQSIDDLSGQCNCVKALDNKAYW
jgi:predicted N-acetyltransferase YhbS